MIEELREKALSLPMNPGVYIMKNAAGEVIYVGKAKHLKNRVSSYFHGAHNQKTEAMISNIDRFEVIIAASEFEALVLENSLIKHHMPKYNILLKDDKGYPFVRLDRREEFPTFTMTAKRANDGAAYFGPFGGRSSTRAAIDAVLKSLKLPTCSRVFPRDIGKGRPCLNYHLGVCDAYCRESSSRKRYREAVEKAAMIFDGRTSELIRELKADMEREAEELHFEEAARLRDMVNAVSSLETKQNVWACRPADTDAIGFYHGTAKSCFVVLHYIGGQLLGKDAELLLDSPEEDAEAVSSLVRQYYAMRGAAPREVLLGIDTEDTQELAMFLSEISERPVSVQIPKRGIRRVFTEAAGVNAREETERATTAEERVSRTAAWLAQTLNLPSVPSRIEAFDVSNLGNTDIVASMTVFVNGKPLKRDYRKFKIQSADSQDDYGSMREAVTRRFQHYLDGDAKFSPLPDLLLIDGGAIHARTARSAMEALGVSVPVFGMVKDDRHRTRALETPEGEEIGLTFPAAFAFVGRIQEETHRFAIEFQRNLRSKPLKHSELDDIPGIGQTRKAALLKKYKSISAIAEADESELGTVVPKNAAHNVYVHFHQEAEKE